ncbi:MAG: hypothetical protein PVJ55_09585 [Anaerolineae bacterium]
MMNTITTLQAVMAASVFLLGLSSCISGLWMILSRQYRKLLKSISAQSAKVSSKAVTDAGLAPLIQAMSGLVEAIDKLVRTSIGVGVFLCLAGVVLCLASFWMLSFL